MYDLAHRPAAFAVRRVEMRVVQALHRGAHLGRGSRNLIDRLLAPSQRHFGGHRKLSNRIARVHRRSEEHTSELQSQSNLVCRLLLEKKKKIYYNEANHHDI